MLPGNWFILLGVIAMGFWGGWETQGWHRDSKEKDRVEAQAETDRLAHQSAIKRVDAVVAAQNAASTRAVVARRDADDARTELDRVRSLSDAAVEAARVSNEACFDRAAALNDVFKSSTRAIEDLAAKADRHVNDLKTLTDAWPTNEKSP